MKRTEFSAMVLVAGALTLGCSGAGPGTGEIFGTGGTGASSQPAAGSGGIQQAAGHPGNGGTSSVGGTSALGGTAGLLAGTTEAGGSMAGPSGSGAGGAAGGATGASGGAGGAAGGVTGASGGATRASGGITTAGGTAGQGGSTVGGTTGQGGGKTGQSGGVTSVGGTTGSAGGTTGQSSGTAGSAGAGGTVNSGGATSTGGTGGKTTTTSSGGTSSSGGVGTTGGSSATGGSGGKGGSSATGGSTGTSSCGAVAGVVGTLIDSGPGATNPSPPDPAGITFKDTDGDLVNAHGGGIIRVCNTFYLHGEYFLSTTTDNDFNGFSMYSSPDLVTWKKEGNKGIILPQQSSGQLGPNRKGERPHIIKCPATGEFVLYAHSADVTYQVDKEVVYATSPTVNAVYSFKGSLLSSSGAIAAHSDMSAYADDTGAYVVTESGWVFTLSSDCHSWVSSKQYSVLNGTTGGIEAPTVFKDTSGTYYFIGSDKTGWRANDDFYSTAKSMNGPWTYQGYIAPEGKKAWMTQSTWVLPIVGSKGTVFMYWGDHWYGNQDTTNPGVHNYLATYVFQPLVLGSGTTLLPTYQASWKIDIGAGTWSQ